MNVLIVGKNSYVGTHISEWLKIHDHSVYLLNSRTDEWKTYNYGNIDCIIHVAAIVHEKNEVPWEIYHKVNTLLPIHIAKIAKKQGVKQFIFFSTMGIYGKGKSLPYGTTISEFTEISPTSYYGKSKLEAEAGLKKLEGGSFNISIIRPPSIYGKNCPGNYISTFKNIASLFPVFPYSYSEAKQSFIYIDNLSELVRLIIEHKRRGVFTPQDNVQISTPDLLSLMAIIQEKKIHMSKFLGAFPKVFQNCKIITKLYGGINYSDNISNHFDGAYQKVSLREGMKRTLI